MANILIVDDNFDDLQNMKCILEKKGYGVSVATNGAQAIDLAQTESFELFLVDVKMPTLSGYDLVQLLREKNNSHSKIIFVSILKKKDVELENVNDFIQKPFAEKEFLAKVKSVLGGK
jgi:two-component system response regulator SaeR